MKTKSICLSMTMKKVYSLHSLIISDACLSLTIVEARNFFSFSYASFKNLIEYLLSEITFQVYIQGSHIAYISGIGSYRYVRNHQIIVLQVNPANLLQINKGDRPLFNRQINAQTTSKKPRVITFY